MENDNEKKELLMKKIEEYVIDENRPVSENEIRTKFKLGILDKIPFDDQNIYQIKCEYYLKTSNRTGSFHNDKYLFALKQLKQFWINEIEILLQDANKEYEIDSLRSAIGKSFVNFYGLRSGAGREITYNSCDAGLINSEGLLDFLNEHKTRFYVLKNSIYESITNVKVGLVEWVERGRIASPNKIIKNEVISVLRKPSSSTLTLDQLTYRINRKDIKAGIPKPFDKQMIQEIISADKDRFHVDKDSGIIKLNDDIEYLAKYFKENQQLLQNFDGEKESAGILAITYIGKEFPLKEAKEYVNTRPIIYLYLTSDLARDFGDLFYTTPEESGLFDTEFSDYLRAIAPPNIAIREWLQENVSVSYYEESFNELRLMLPKLLEKFSPVLNVNQNPGNLFQYTLNNKLEIYKQVIELQKTTSENKKDSDIPTILRIKSDSIRQDENEQENDTVSDKE